LPVLFFAHGLGDGNLELAGQGGGSDGSHGRTFNESIMVS
jgi:hypothetical protein